MRVQKTLSAVLISIGLATTAQAESFRGELLLGAQGGDPKVEFGGASDTLDTDVGYTAGLGLWVDGLGADMLSLGLQYQRYQGSDFNASGTTTVLGTAVNGTLDLEPTIDVLLAKAALRDNEGSLVNEKFHPYVGIGIGIARTEVDASASAAFTVNGQNFLATGSTSDSDTGFAGQVFLGADYDITDSIYVGGSAAYLATNSDVFGAETKFRNFSVAAVVGFKF